MGDLTSAGRLRVVVVGAGFGGLEAVRALARANADVTLIDRNNHHVFQPLLYQVATAALSPGDIAWPVRSIFRRQANVTVVMADVDGVDAERRVVHADGGPAFPYDILVLATGATHSYFGHEEWATAAPGLKTIDDATDIRRRLLLAFERAEIATDEMERRRLLTFIVVGGGPTGVELAGAMVELARHSLARDFRRIDPAAARVVLIEAGPRLLPTLPEQLSVVARRALERMGVQVLAGTRVTGCEAGVVHCGEDRIAASTIVWAAGVVASPAGAWDRHRARPGWPTAGRAGSHRPRTSRDLCRRRFGGRSQRRRAAGPGRGAGSQADGALRRAGDCRTCRPAQGTCAVPISPPRRPGHDRASVSRGRNGRRAVDGVARLDLLECGPRLVSDRLPKPGGGHVRMGLELCHGPARGSAHHPGTTTPRAGGTTAARAAPANNGQGAHRPRAEGISSSNLGRHCSPMSASAAMQTLTRLTQALVQAKSPHVRRL